MLKDDVIFNKDKFSRYSNIDFDFSSSFEIIGFGDKVYIATPSYIYRTSSITNMNYNFEVIIDYSNQDISASATIEMFEMNEILFVQVGTMTYCFDKNGRCWQAGYYITGTKLGNVDGAGYYTLNSEKFPKFIIEEINYVQESHRVYSLIKTAYFKPISETEMVLEFIKEPKVINTENIIRPDKVFFRDGEVYALERDFDSQTHKYIYNFYKITDEGYLSEDNNDVFLEIRNPTAIPKNLFYSSGNRIFFFFGYKVWTFDNNGNMLEIYTNDKPVQQLNAMNYKNSTILLTENELLSITNGKYVQKLLTIEDIKLVSNYTDIVFNNFKLVDNIAIINVVATVPLGKLNMYFAYNLSSGNIQDLFDIYNDINVTKFFATTENNKVQILQNNSSGKLVNVFETGELASDKISVINKSQYEEISGSTNISNEINSIELDAVRITKSEDAELGSGEYNYDNPDQEVFWCSVEVEQGPYDSEIITRTEKYTVPINIKITTDGSSIINEDKPVVRIKTNVYDGIDIDEGILDEWLANNIMDETKPFPSLFTNGGKLTSTNETDEDYYYIGNYEYNNNNVLITSDSFWFKERIIVMNVALGISITETINEKSAIVKGTSYNYETANRININRSNDEQEKKYTMATNELFQIEGSKYQALITDEIISKNIDGRMVVKIKTSNDYNFPVGKLVKIKDLKNKWVANGSDFEIQGIEEELVGVNFQQTITCVQKYKNSLQS